ncbi:MAG: IS1380 family transposase, partial [Tannerella sp.]|nr:IS1380 family transposase [Tannerella sp.]
MKSQKKSESITPFAGISFVIEEFNKCGFSKLIDNHFGMRCLTGYQYSEIFR